MSAIQFVQTTPEELTNSFITELVGKIQDLEKKWNFKQETELLLPSDVADFFKVSKVTVWKWTKAGKLKSYSISGSGKVYYKRHEIEASLTNL